MSLSETEPGAATAPWLRTTVRDLLRLPDDEETVGEHTLRELGARSVHVVALQFRILQTTAVELEIRELTGEEPVDGIARLIDQRRLAAAPAGS